MKKALTILTLILLLSITGFTADFSSVITTLGARESTLTIYKQYAVTDDLTVPANITLKFLQGGSLTITGGKNVAINGHIESGLYQIFEGAGTVSFGFSSILEIFPQWFGATGDGVTEDAVLFNKGLNTMPNGGTYLIPYCTFKFSEKIVIPNAGIDIKGLSMTYSRFDFGDIGAAVNSIEIPDGVTDINFEKISIIGRDAGAAHEIALLGSHENINFKKVNITTEGTGRCISIATALVASNFTNVYTWGGQFGFYIRGTSLSFVSCFARQADEADGAGFDVWNGTYINFQACAADENWNGYRFDGAAHEITLTACGAEANKKGAAYVSNSTGITFINFRGDGNNTDGDAWIQLINAPDYINIIGGWDNSPHANSTYSLGEAEGTDIFIVNPKLDKGINPFLLRKPVISSDIIFANSLSLDVPVGLTIAADAITVTKSYHILTPQGGAVDDLATINGGVDGMLLILSGDGTFQIDVKHNVGNILLTAAGDYLLPSTTERILLQYDATLTKWIELSEY